MIVVNATALRFGGGLTILQQFIESIPQDDFEYLVFVDQSVDISINKPNLKIVKQDVTSFFNRFKWDAYGLNKWLKINKIKVDIALSLQNTNFRLDARCPNFVYFHNSLPLYPNQWNPLKKIERNLWFYRNIYPFFIRMFINSRTEFFVQLDFIKKGFVNRFKVDENKVHIVFPVVNASTKIEKADVIVDQTVFNLFYPATNQFFKNHMVIFQALKSIDDKLMHKIVLYLTNNEGEFNPLPEFRNIEIVFLGKVPFDTVMNLYQQVDCLVFPSYIETLGLPLIEAASTGLFVLAADLPYAHEVLNGYEGVKFIDVHHVEQWANAIFALASENKKIKFEKFVPEKRNSWPEFFEILKNKRYV